MMVKFIDFCKLSNRVTSLADNQARLRCVFAYLLNCILYFTISAGKMQKNQIYIFSQVNCIKYIRFIGRKTRK